VRRLYRAVCVLIEAHAEAINNPEEDPGPQPDGADAMVERSGQHEPDELNAHYNRDQGDNYEDHRRVGFTAPIRPRPKEPRP